MNGNEFFSHPTTSKLSFHWSDSNTHRDSVLVPTLDIQREAAPNISLAPLVFSGFPVVVLQCLFDLSTASMFW
jgi:hypothetical protein